MAVPMRLRTEGPALAGAGRGLEAAERGFAFPFEFERDVLDEERVEVDRVAVLLERLAGEDPRTSTSGSA